MYFVCKGAQRFSKALSSPHAMPKCNLGDVQLVGAGYLRVYIVVENGFSFHSWLPDHLPFILQEYMAHRHEPK